MCNDLTEKMDVELIKSAYAHRLGDKSYRSLKRDRKFKKAVKSIVTNSCTVSGQFISC